MDTEEFIEQLSDAQNMIMEENYKNALNILYKLREIEREGNFDYSLTHELYQLISNAESLLNQKAIIEGLSHFTQKEDRREIDFESLNAHLLTEIELDLKPDLLKREIELLILRNKIPFTIQGNKLILS